MVGIWSPVHWWSSHLTVEGAAALIFGRCDGTVDPPAVAPWDLSSGEELFTVSTHLPRWFWIWSNVALRGARWHRAADYRSSRRPSAEVVRRTCRKPLHPLCPMPPRVSLKYATVPVQADPSSAAIQLANQIGFEFKVDLALIASPFVGTSSSTFLDLGLFWATMPQDDLQTEHPAVGRPQACHVASSKCHQQTSSQSPRKRLIGQPIMEMVNGMNWSAAIGHSLSVMTMISIALQIRATRLPHPIPSGSSSLLVKILLISAPRWLATLKSINTISARPASWSFGISRHMDPWFHSRCTSLLQRNVWNILFFSITITFFLFE